MGSDKLRVERSTDETCKRWVTTRFFHRVETLISKVANAGCKTKPKHVAERENVICKSCGVSVVLFDPQLGLMIEQSVEHPFKCSATAVFRMLF